MTAALLGKVLGPTENLGPVVGKPLNMLRVTRMGERMVQDGVGKAALVMRRRQRKEGRFTAGKIEQRGTRH